MVSFAFLSVSFPLEKFIKALTRSSFLLCDTYMTVTRPEIKILNPKLRGHDFQRERRERLRKRWLISIDSTIPLLWR